MKRFTPWIFALLLALSVPAWADVSRTEAAAMAQKATGGRILAVDLVQRDGRAFWRVKVLTAQGEVQVVLIDAASSRTR